MNSRERVLAALEGNAYDRIPVDFLATTEIWEKLESYFSVPRFIPKEGDYFDASWEDILRKLEVDCRVVSYDQFCEVPEDAFPEKGRIEYWKVLSRSTPARM
jgi:uroporphyrinogen decarboxylase